MPPQSGSADAKTSDQIPVQFNGWVYLCEFHVLIGLVRLVDRTRAEDHGLHAELLQSLKRAGAKTVAVDILFAEPSDPDADNALAKAINDHGSVVMASDIRVINEANYLQQRAITPLPQLLDAGAETGFVNLPLHSDGIVRHMKTEFGGLFSFSELATSLFGNRPCCPLAENQADPPPMQCPSEAR